MDVLETEKECYNCLSADSKQCCDECNRNTELADMWLPKTDVR